MASAAILAGGRAARFAGRDKGLLLVGGRTIRDRQLTALAPIADDIMIVLAFDQARAAQETASRIPGAGGAPETRVIMDRVPACGPLGGIDAALTAARDDLVVVVACDMPFVTARLFSDLLALSHDVDAVVPQTARGYHPLCAVYARRCQRSVASRLAAGRLKVLDLLSDLRVRLVAPEELERLGHGGRVLANVNTPSDYEALEATAGHEL
jgi:molybdopterin-guanine dinucleotide biosynthesis protein A